MTGIIRFTTGRGGFIRPDGAAHNIPFSWRDTRLSKYDVGAFTRVEFCTESVRGRQIAFAIRRAGTT